MEPSDQEKSGCPFAETEAAKMLREGLRQSRAESGVSLRSVAAGMGLRQATSLSHMATGRIPIPVDRALELASRIGIDTMSFLKAVLSQRFPGVSWNEFMVSRETLDECRSMKSLISVLGVKIFDVSESTLDIVKDVISDRWPEERWLTIPQIPAVTLLNNLRPSWRSSGLGQDDEDAISRALA